MEKQRVHCLVDKTIFDNAREILERRDDDVDITLTTTQIIESCIKFFVKELGVTIA